MLLFSRFLLFSLSFICVSLSTLSLSVYVYARLNKFKTFVEAVEREKMYCVYKYAQESLSSKVKSERIKKNRFKQQKREKVSLFSLRMKRASLCRFALELFCSNARKKEKRGKNDDFLTLVRTFFFFKKYSN